MIEQLRHPTERKDSELPHRNRNASLTPLRAVAVQLLLATGADSALEHLSVKSEPEGQTLDRIPRALRWAPLLLAPLAAAANIEHIRRPSERTGLALRFVTAATVGFGTSLFVLDSLAHRERPTRLGSLAFASAGVLGLVIDRQEREIARTEESLRRRARVVERLVPHRKAKLDRIVVHV